jgi:toxin-antitoxin system PIN domain toxin
MRYLLDVNVLLAAIWVTHTEHARADGWVQNKELATCPITELGFLRISTHPKALKATMGDARKLLEHFHSQLNPAFTTDDLKPLKSHPGTSDSVTDHYLADLAASRGMKLATLDANLKHPAAELIPGPPQLPQIKK